LCALQAPTGSGPYGLADYCEQIRTYWDAREAPNVHLFHYADLWAEREGEMRRVASVLGGRHRTGGAPRAVAGSAGLLPVGRDPRLGIADVSG